MAPSKVKVPLRPGSDGDPTQRPTDPLRTEVTPPTIYLEKIGALWMKSRGEALPHVQYSLQSLPAGYALFQRARPTDPKHIDKWLYGHPSGKVFDSPNRFYPHFKYLMDNGGNNIGCPCDVCSTKGSTTPSSRTSSSRASQSGRPLPPIHASFQTNATHQKGKQKAVNPGADTRRVDEEGTPDVYRNLIDRLKSQGTLDEPIIEPMSLDWQAEQETISNTITSLHENPQWLPREGEIVLFVRQIPEGYEACWTPSHDVRLYNPETKHYAGYPVWEAGFVGQTPAEVTSLDDLVTETAKEMSISSSGVRVEPLPDPNSTDKSLSKRYQYVPLHHTRPFVFWKEFLTNIPEHQWHPTIKHALTVMSTFALVRKQRFRGTWPTAQIYSHGIYIGPELLAVGDTIRLTPKTGLTHTTDVLVITSIRLHLSSLDVASDNDYDEGRPYNTNAFIYGRAYTTDQSRSDKQWLSIDDIQPTVMQTYKQWHPLHPINKEMQVPFQRCLGRLFEAKAMDLWFPRRQRPLHGDMDPAHIDQGRPGLQEARAFACANDQRIVDTLGSNWFWGDTRVEALNLQTVNGLEVGKYDTDRDPKDWRAQLRIIEKAQIERDRVEQQTELAGQQRNLRAFMAPGSEHNLTVRPGDHHGRSAGSGSGTASSSAGARSSNGRAAQSVAGQKRGKVIELSDPDDEDKEEDELQAQAEVRRHTRIIHDTKEVRKKAKVAVVVD